MIKDVKDGDETADENNKRKFGRVRSCFKKQNDEKELGNRLSPAGR